jgi:hypothetical protein
VVEDDLTDAKTQVVLDRYRAELRARTVAVGPPPFARP